MASQPRQAGGTSRLRGRAQRPGDQPRAAARYHGDRAVVPGMLDFAVNVRTGGPYRHVVVGNPINPTEVLR